MIVNLIFRGWCSTSGRRFYRLEFQEAYGAWVGFLPLDVESIVNSYGCQSWPASCRRPEYSGFLLRHQKEAKVHVAKMGLVFMDKLLAHFVFCLGARLHHDPTARI